MGYPPEWALVLEAANYDPLRAQEIYEHINSEWWHRWLSDRKARIAASEATMKKAK